MPPQRKLIKYILDEKGCFVCTSHCKSRDGYPFLRRNGLLKHMHRILWEEKFGLLDPKIVLRHRCDNPSCINLDHLLPGTLIDNVNDMIERGRNNFIGIKGENHRSSKLKEHQIKEIRNSTVSSRKIAIIYGVSRINIIRIRQYKLWKHVM